MNLLKIAAAANATYSGNLQGFITCDVLSTNPPILVYYFSDHISSHSFLMQRELEGMHVSIKNNEPNNVIEYR
jgi:hypothetical protein